MIGKSVVDQDWREALENGDKIVGSTRRSYCTPLPRCTHAWTKQCQCWSIIVHQSCVVRYLPKSGPQPGVQKPEGHDDLVRNLGVSGGDDSRRRGGSHGAVANGSTLGPISPSASAHLRSHTTTDGTNLFAWNRVQAKTVIMHVFSTAALLVRPPPLPRLNLPDGSHQPYATPL